MPRQEFSDKKLQKEILKIYTRPPNHALLHDQNISYSVSIKKINQLLIQQG